MKFLTIWAERASERETIKWKQWQNTREGGFHLILLDSIFGHEIIKG